MAVRSVSASKAQYTTGLGAGVNSSGAARPWVRNKSWLTFTAPTASEQKFIGLHAVWPESNFLALSAAGDYTVDWGDGVVENFSSGVIAQHEYDFADADLANTNAPVTLQGGADTVTRTSHGYVNGDTVRFYNIVTTTGISADTPYFVIDATANTFKVSLTAGGSTIDLVSDGSATLLPYKQAIVQVYPQAGQDLTALNLSRRHSSVSVAYSSGFIDIALAGASLTDLRISVATPGGFTQDILFGLLENVNIVRTDCRQLSELFFNCRALQQVSGLATTTAPATSVAVTFTDSGDTVNATGHGFRNGDIVIFTSITATTGITTYTSYYVVGATADTFQVASSPGGAALPLTTDGSGVALQGTDLTRTFRFCTALQSVPLFNTSSAINMQAMFQNCSVLKSVPLFNTTSVTNMQSMFQSCPLLESVPLLNTTSVTNMLSMFNGCSLLKSVPLFNTSSVTNMQGTFTNCVSLQSVPLFNTAAVTTTSGMFQNCTSLESVPLFNTASVTNMSSMFSGCLSLKSVPLFNTASVTSMLNMFQNCSALQSVPLFNTASVTSMQSMFGNCLSLQSVPLFNTASVTSMINMFSGCTALQSVPALVTTAIPASTGFNNMLNGCSSLSRIQAKDFRFTFSVGFCKLSATALNEIYTNLPTVTGQTITVTGNYGTAGANHAIATGKGWSVVV